MILSYSYLPTLFKETSLNNLTIRKGSVEVSDQILMESPSNYTQALQTSRVCVWTETESVQVSVPTLVSLDGLFSRE